MLIFEFWEDTLDNLERGKKQLIDSDKKVFDKKLCFFLLDTILSCLLHALIKRDWRSKKREQCYKNHDRVTQFTAYKVRKSEGNLINEINLSRLRLNLPWTKCNLKCNDSRNNLKFIILSNMKMSLASQKRTQDTQRHQGLPEVLSSPLLCCNNGLVWLG